MKDSKKPSAEAPGNFIEQDNAFSQSLIWDLQRRFFEREGIAAWNKGTVPHYLSSKPYTAQAYGRLVFAFLRDCYAASETEAFPKLDFGQPVYLMELGAGSGRFAHHFLKQFFELFRESPLKHIPVKYVLTDLAESNLNFWKVHPKLKPWIEQGLLDVAFFDAVKDETLNLQYSGEQLNAQTLKNPLICMANYFFDSIPPDIFYVNNGQLYENTVSLSLADDAPDADHPEYIQHIEIKNQQTAIDTNYYEDPLYNRILEHYQKELDNTTVLFPITGLRCIRSLATLSKGRMLFITGDKGFSRQQDLMARQGKPKISRHGDCISLLVNYHAIAEYITHLGGAALTIPYRHRSFNICAFLLGEHPQDYIETRHTYREAIEQKNPDDFYCMKKALNTNHEGMTLRQLIGYIRFSGWDHNIFGRCVPALLKLVQSVQSSVKEELLEVVTKVWEHYYPIGETKDLASDIAVLLSNMSYYEEALNYLKYTLEVHGPTATTFYNMSICYYALDTPQTALKYLDKALGQEPEMEEALAFREKIQVKDIPDVKSFFQPE